MGIKLQLNLLDFPESLILDGWGKVEPNILPYENGNSSVASIHNKMSKLYVRCRAKLGVMFKKRLL